VSARPNGWIVRFTRCRYIPRSLKTRYKRMDESVKPILPPLNEALRASAHGLKTFPSPLTGSRSRTVDLADARMVRSGGAAAPHGARLEGGCGDDLHGATDRQMMAPFDWSSEKPATAHTKKANRTGIAAAAGAPFALLSLADLAEVSRREQSAQVRHKLLI
jgi:hypothetical protein